MKWFALKLLGLMVVLLVAPMFITGPDGRPIMSLDDWIPRDLFATAGEAGQRAVELAAELGSSAQGHPDGEQVYMWRDANGTRHYSDTPVEGAQTVKLLDNTLEIPAQRFIQDGTRPVHEASAGKSGRAILLQDRDSRSDAARSAGSSQRAGLESTELEAFVGGDYSKAGEVLKNLPALVEQAKQARTLPPEAR